MLKGAIYSGQAAVASPVSKPEQQSHAAVDTISLSVDTTKGDSMKDKKIGQEWLRPLQKTIVLGASAIIVTLVAVPVWLYEQGKGSLGHLDQKINQVETRVVQQLSSKIELIATGSLASNQQLNQQIVLLQEQFDTKIDAVEKNLESNIHGVETPLNNKIDAVENRLIAMHQNLDTSITAVEVTVVDNGRAISRVEGSLDTVISLLKTRQ